ncbi:MAG TPA: FAD-binding oxidoreductase [Candidatus Korarchaeota archaeon]|nr:FAD-binding oxidoreductase [Candidatus Korarchaeota archaeon]
MPGELSKVLTAIFGEENVLTDEISLASYSFDASNVRGTPDAVVRPTSEEEVEELLTSATEHNYPVTPRGAGTSLVGGPVPTQGGVVLDLLRLNEIYEIDEEAGWAEVGPGVRVSELESKIGGEFYFPINPDGLGGSTIGGLASEDAASSLSAAYGTIRNHVVGIKAVTPTGKWLDLRGFQGGGPRFLLDAILGSEGTLAVITRLTVRLRRRPQYALTYKVELIDSLDALSLYDELLSRGVEPAALDVVHRDVMELVGEGARDVGARALVTLIGSPDCVGIQAKRLEQALEEIKPLSFEVIEEISPGGRALVIQALRQSKFPAIFVSAALPTPQLRDSLPEVERVASRYRIRTLTVTSVPLGWVLVGFAYNPLDEKQVDRANAAAMSTAELFSKAGGVLGYGTGIGASMALPFSKQRPEASAAFAEIKRAFDPAWILNPGKIVPMRG